MNRFRGHSAPAGARAERIDAGREHTGIVPQKRSVKSGEGDNSARATAGQLLYEDGRVSGILTIPIATKPLVQIGVLRPQCVVTKGVETAQRSQKDTDLGEGTRMNRFCLKLEVLFASRILD